MKLRTCLQLSAIFPIVLAAVVAVVLKYRFTNDPSLEHLIENIILAVVGAVGLTMAAIILFYSRSLLARVRTLGDWIDAVLKGDLNDRAGMPTGKDEIGRLSQSLSKMLRELKQAYSVVQKESLDHKQQADESKRQAEASRMGMRHVSEALHKMQESKDQMAQRERREVLEQVVRGVIHDLSEALTPLLGTLDLLRMRPDILRNAAETEQYMDEMRKAVDRAKKTLANLAGVFHKQQHIQGPVDLNHLVEEAVAASEPYWKRPSASREGRIAIKTSLAGKDLVVGEDDDLRDALVNLIANAAEAMPDGGLLAISTKSEKSSVVLEVRDSGGGMAPEVQQRCLEPFYTTKKQGGKGMGLTVVSGVVQRHGGTMNIQSKVNEGTTVSISLPVWRAAAKEGEGEALLGPARNLRILLVDDDKWSRDTIGRELESVGHRVTSVDDGHRCLEIIQKDAFDVVFVDRAMPGMTGDELSSTIKGKWPDIPVVMLTGFGHTMIEEVDIPVTVDLVLAKPISADELQKALSQMRRGRP